MSESVADLMESQGPGWVPVASFLLVFSNARTEGPLGSGF